MKVFFHEDFYAVYTSDPAAAPGRMEAIVREIRGMATFVPAVAAREEDIAAVHTARHIEAVRRDGLYPVASLAAGGAVQAADAGLQEPAFGLVRPPGHHASAGSAWGFCFFNNMAIALDALRRRNKIRTAFVLDFDLHFGDGTVNLLGGRGWATLCNPTGSDREVYLASVEKALAEHPADVIGVSAGFDNHQEDWGGLLATEDYRQMGRWVRRASQANGGGCFGILEGGYNHRVLGRNIKAFLEGLEAA